MSETWTIGELAERAAGALGSDARVNGRVRDIPNERLIRWYATIGLLDPPLARRGRVALYGPRHLLQLVAIKRRQAAGRSIADIQIELAGAPDSALQNIALISPYPAEPENSSPEPEHSSPEPARARFWAATGERSTPTPPAGPPPAARVHGVRIAPGVALVLDAADRAPSDADLVALAAAAQPLLAALSELGLITMKSEGTPS
ncbi:hypothetical protein GCM10009555_025050 [Acrocarpospora macrocephala]|uniref:HTH merR-type domain-containing protein n=1 Tax=Acrocarpospora macrocephala TaxID=150177 RepID=A0A5M3WM55_9ACTN|nr:MerR family transcriptional regulator [Acrocarpospora macrocephala]GES10365.1 hypothetical protein Amac_039620 [Acrocarpospora macrocephala]